MCVCLSKAHHSHNMSVIGDISYQWKIYSKKFIFSISTLKHNGTSLQLYIVEKIDLQRSKKRHPLEIFGTL